MIFKKFESRGCFNKNSIMLIGERYADNHSVGERENTSAFDSNKNSSKYLNDLISLSEFKNKFYITNAFKFNDFRDEQYIKEEIELIQPSCIIALGNKSSNFLKKINVIHKKFYHPQFLRRFHYHEIDKYSKLLEKIIKNELD